MTAKELKEALAKVPDDAVIVFSIGAYNGVEMQKAKFNEYLNIFYIS